MCIVCNICLQSRATIFNNFIPEISCVCYKSCTRIDITKSSLALKVCGQPDEKEDRKYGRGEGVKTHRRVRVALHPLRGLAAFLKRGRHCTKHMARKQRHKVPSAPPSLQALNKQTHVVVKF